MAKRVHKEALGAWRELREHGGIEPDDRDEGIEDRLKAGINPGRLVKKAVFLHE
jgi:hypothetical protein